MKILPHLKISHCIPGKAFMFFLALVPLLGFTQNSEREYLGYEVNDNNILVRTNDGHYRFQSYTSQIFETTFVPGGEEYDPASYAVVLKPANSQVQVTETNQSILIDTDGIFVTIAKAPFQVSYSYNGAEIISEKQGYSESEDLQRLEFNIDGEEKLMGGGARALGMNRRGYELKLSNEANYGYGAGAEVLNYSLPVVFSSRQYLLHFDNAAIGSLDLGSAAANVLSFETAGGRKTYQLVVGDTWEEIVENYTLLTGKQPMPPRWVFGNFSSRFGYRSSQEVLATISKYKQDNIPVDAIVLDLFWFGKEIKGTMGNLEFDRDSFPEPEKMISSLLEQGVKTVLITEPYILTSSGNWDDAVQNNILATNKAGEPYVFDFYFGNTGLIDIFKPEAREWFWNKYKKLTEMGVSGWWGDLGEPEMHPEDIVHSTGTAKQVHNLYGHSWAGLIHQGYQRDFPGKRPFILMRAGAAGSQRFGLIPWSGDVSRSWEGLQVQPEISLQMGVQGLAYMHSDLGGFAGNVENNELYVRWLQYGVFQPVFRPHAQEEVPSEPVFKEPHTKELAKKAIELRYRLLPYNYTLAYLNSSRGIPLMRPVFFEEPEDPKAYDVAHTYLWGNDFLISPVMESNAKEKEVYFPGNSNWFNFYSGKRYSGGEISTVTVEEEGIPTFIRGGAFIPMAKPMQSTSNYSASVLEVHYYYDNEVKESSGYLYHDDGITAEAFQSGEYEEVNFESRLAGNAIDLIISKEVGRNFEPEIEQVDLIVHNLNRPVQFVWVNGIKYTGKNYMHEGRLMIPVYFNQKVTTIRIDL